MHYFLLKRRSRSYVQVLYIMQVLYRNTHLPIAALLLAPELQRSKHLRPETEWRVNERRLVVVNRRALPDEIDFGGLEKASSLDEFPREEGDGS